MRRYYLSVLILLFLLSAILACGQKRTATEEDRSDGGRLFVRSCQSCHALPKPGSQSDEKWPVIVKRYGPRAKLSEREIASITAYLIANN